MDDSPSSDNPHFMDRESQSTSDVISNRSLGSDDIPSNETPILRTDLDVTDAADEESILRRAAAELAERKAELRALATLSSVRNTENPVETLTASLVDHSATVRAAAVRALYLHDSDFATSFLNRAICEGSPEHRQNLGIAIVESGLTDQDPSLEGEPHDYYSAVSLLFLLAKAGEVGSLLRIIRNHSNLNLRLALINTLANSKSSEVNAAFQQLLVDPSLPKEVRSAVMEAIVQSAENK
jgi:hypothetical protein